jgi:hypothetical protein
LGTEKYDWNIMNREKRYQITKEKKLKKLIKTVKTHNDNNR